VNKKQWTANGVVVNFLILSAVVTSADAQTKVAIVDIGLVFKNHPRFTAGLAELKSAADTFQAESQNQRQQLLLKADQLNQYTKESVEYQDLEASLAKESATLEVDQRAKMRDLLRDEALLHFNTYVEVSEFISQYCQEYGIQLVLRFNSETMEAKNPQSIMQRVNGNVVHYSQTADITQPIIQRVAQAATTAQSSTPNR